MENKEEIKQRVVQRSKIYGVVLGVLLLYYFWVRLTGLAIPCIFHVVTGFYCPGCGITRMLMALAEGNLALAYSCNEALFWLAPLALADFIWYHYHYFRYGIQNTRFHKASVVVMLVVLVGFGIWRNWD